MKSGITSRLRGHRYWPFAARLILRGTSLLLLAIPAQSAGLSYRIDAINNGIIYGPQSTNFHVVDARQGSGSNGGTARGGISGGLFHASLDCSVSGLLSGDNAEASITSWEQLTAHQPAGRATPVRVVIRPFISTPWHSESGKSRSLAATDSTVFNLDVRGPAGLLPRREYRIEFFGYGASGGDIVIRANAMAPLELALTDLQTFRVDWVFSVSASAPFGSAWIASHAWFTVDVENGDLTTTSGEPVPTSPGAPHIGLPGFGSPGGGSPGGGSGAGIPIVVTGGPTNNTFRGCVVSATNVAAPMTHWTPVLTNAFALDGSFTNTIPINTNDPQRTFRLLLAP